ncbi:MAG: response regulator [Nitrosarchaeum sp.]
MKSVIVVDDDQDIRDTLTDILEFKGIRVLAKAINGYDAVEKFSKYGPDVVLMDVMMPKYDGFYGLEHIRKLDPDAKIIMITADQTNETKDKLQKLNQHLIVFKPFDTDKLVNMINE